MKYTREDLNERCEKYYNELIKKGIDADEIQDLCLMFLENGGDRRPRKKYVEKKANEENFERDLVPFVEHNQELVYSIDPIIDFRILQKNIFESLSTLTEREIYVLYLIYAEERSLAKAGEYFNVTKERIRQLHSKALRKLRHPSRSRKLRGYMNYNINTVSEHLKEYMCSDDAIGRAYKYVENGGLPIFDHHKKPNNNDIKIIFADNGVNVENVFYPCFDPCKFSETWDKFRATLTGKRIFHKNTYDIMMDQRKIMVEEIERIIYYGTEQDKMSRNINTKTMRKVSGIFNYIKYNILEPAERNNSDPELINSRLASLLNFMDTIKRNDIDVTLQCQALLEKFPKRGAMIVSLYDLNFLWATENYSSLPPVLSKYIRKIDKFRRNRSIKTLINPIIFNSLPFVEVLKEYEKMLKTDEISKCINEMNEFIKTNSDNKCNFIPVIIKNKSYIVSKQKSSNNNWKRDLYIVKQTSDQKNKQKSRGDQETNGAEHYPQMKYISDYESYNDMSCGLYGYTIVKNNRIGRGKHIIDCIIERLNNSKPSIEIFVNKFLFIYKIAYRRKKYPSSNKYDKSYLKYYDFTRNNIEWITSFIRNMICEGVVDINNHKINMFISCNKLDGNMVNNDINKVINDIGYSFITEYDGCGFYCNDGLDYHYMVLLDLLHILRDNFNYNCNYKPIRS